jgi:hypothetical protein
MPNIHDRPKELDPVSKIVIAALIVLGLLIVTYVVIDYAARLDETRPHAAATWPADAQAETPAR